MEADDTKDEVREREAKDSTNRSEGGAPGAYGVPEHGERADPQRDPQSDVPRDPVPSEPGDTEAKDDPTIGKETRGG